MLALKPSIRWCYLQDELSRPTLATLSLFRLYNACTCTVEVQNLSRRKSKEVVLLQ